MCVNIWWQRIGSQKDRTQSNTAVVTKRCLKLCGLLARKIRFTNTFTALMHLGSHWDAYSNLVYCKPWHGHAAGVIGPLWGESSGLRYIPSQRTSNADLWCFFFVFPLFYEQGNEQTVELPVIWDDHNILDVKVQLLLNVNIVPRIYQRFIEMVRQLNWGFTISCLATEDAIKYSSGY